MGFFQLLPIIHPHQLGHQSTPNLTVIGSSGHLRIGCEAHFLQLGVHHEIQGKQVGAGLFEGGSVVPEGFGGHPRVELTGAMTQTLMHIHKERTGLGPELLGTL